MHAGKRAQGDGNKKHARRTLDCSRDALLLQAADVLSSQLAGQERIFGKGFKVPAAERMPVHADGRTQQDVRRPCFRLVAQFLADMEQQVFVPCSRQRDATGEQSGLQLVRR